MSVHELPSDLQEVYDKLRLSEEDQETIDNFLEKALDALHEVNDGRKSDKGSIVVGELRADEAINLLDKWNSGHGGGCASIQANSVLDVKGQLRLIRDKCPDIFPLIDMSELGYCPNNYGMEVADEENCCSSKETCNPCFFKSL